MTWSYIEPDYETKADRYVRHCVVEDATRDHFFAHIAQSPGIGPYKVHVRTSHALDIGGMMSAGAHRFSYDLHGLELVALAIHVEHLLSWYAPLVPRSSGLINMPSWPVMLVVTPERYAEVIAWLRSIEAEALAFADVENAAHNDKFATNPHPHVRIAPRPVRPMERA